MLLASVAFTYTFTYREYMFKSRGERSDDDEDIEEAHGADDRKPFISAFIQSSMPDDVFARHTTDLLVTIPVDALCLKQ